jgi:hypothetical protein
MLANVLNIKQWLHFRSGVCFKITWYWFWSMFVSVFTAPPTLAINAQLIDVGNATGDKLSTDGYKLK